MTHAADPDLPPSGCTAHACVSLPCGTCKHDTPVRAATFEHAANLLIYRLVGRESANGAERSALRAFLGMLGLSVQAHQLVLPLRLPGHDIPAS